MAPYKFITYLLTKSTVNLTNEITLSFGLTVLRLSSRPSVISYQ